MPRFKKTYVIISIIAALVILDQWSKWYIKTHYYLYESYHVWGSWFQLYFVENEGMAFGITLGNNIGKIVLSIVRILALILGFTVIRKCIKKRSAIGLIYTIAVIYAGAIGNTIDSLFYGLIYEESSAAHIASLLSPESGYAPFLFGKVVDMLYFPIIQTNWPDWLPVIGGKKFEFFSPIFNIADACVSVGTFALLIVYRKHIGPLLKK